MYFLLNSNLILFNTLAGSIVLNSYYSKDIPVFISALNCSGSESSVWECAQSNSVNKYCNYQAAVACLGKEILHYDGKLG